MDHPIDITGLDHSYGAGETALQVLFGVDLRIAAGSFVVLMGASGSGKTTLLSLLGCLREVQSGRVSVLGRPLHGADEATRIDIRRRVGFIFQAHNLHDSLTAGQNVRMGLDVHGKLPGADAATLRVLDLLGLADRIDYRPAKLSGGQKQRVAIARALVGNPEIVFADEPTAALDRDNGIRVVDLLRRLGRARGTTTLMVTHDPRILEFADRILTMADGRITQDTARI
jgi:putative ABC transport system ATP-binding protein